MKSLFNLRKNYFYYFLIIYLIIGCYASLKVGITHDERFELDNWNLSKNLISNFFLNTNFQTRYLYGEEAYMTAFYGVGFHFLSYPFELISSFFIKEVNLTSLGKTYLSKHPTVFIFFLTSGIFLNKIIFRITKDFDYSSISAILFLTYPYLIGHSFFNIKDIPFMSVWVICSYLLIDILTDFFNFKKIKTYKIVLLSVITGYLFSIKIVGILISIQYLIFILVFINYSKINFIQFIKSHYKLFFLSILLILITTYLLQPNFWSNPTTIFYAIDFFKNHIQTVCTITLGECMKAQKLPPTYLPIWFFFKLPVIIIFGFLLFPLIEKKLFLKDEKGYLLISLILTVFTFIFLLIFSNAILYDELRHVIFLIPLIFIISLSFLFLFSKKIGISLISILIIFFIFQNIKIFPYNYVWLNNFTHFLNVNKNFELDYWGSSTKNVAKYLSNQNISEPVCIISNRNDALKQFLNYEKINCFKNLQSLNKENKRPFYLALMERKLNKTIPSKCTNIHNEKIKINFSDQDIILAKIFKCH